MKNMSLSVDPRGDLPSILIQPCLLRRPISKLFEHDPKRSTQTQLSKHRGKSQLCYDWIFSGATNVHLAVDKASFKTYTKFDSYVLSMASQDKILVKGIGTVELKIRTKPGSTRTERNVVLDKVLHVPDYLCNIFSDTYFTPAQHYQHSWTAYGVSFSVLEKGRWRRWGYTENFCGLDRLVTSRKHHGRSPMLEDPDREVFSINVTWPQGQRDKWEQYVATETVRLAAKHLQFESALQAAGEEVSQEMQHVALRKSSRAQLSELDPNMPLIRKTPTRRTSSVGATLVGMAGLFDKV